ncbi:diguanylate cyclase (plasmid) [Ralstonia pseudosolanacearum]|uniref:Diguanylate cyclase n=1 Tax=Ralstonia solanacearum TaxID=305 RepID=A0AA92EHU3_RALSL|nr:diguanylate cyclase [Ralstonia pseudosolanacearum]
MSALPSLLALPPGLDPATLRAVFQPIFRLSTSEVLGYEALLRGPAGSAIESPAALFALALARDTGNAIALEIAAARIAVRAFSSLRLPGKLFLNFSAQAMRRLLEARAEFVACYVDLNHFKPFNDQHGYWQGDEMLKMAAAVLAAACEPTRDFLGHVGGDDFLVLFQSADWRTRIQRAMTAFNGSALAKYTPADRAAGGIHAEDRKGLPAFFRCVTMAVGALQVRPGGARSSDNIGAAAALAKQSDHGFHFETMPPAGTRTSHFA